MVDMEYICGQIIGQARLAFHAHMNHVTVGMEIKIKMIKGRNYMNIECTYSSRWAWGLTDDLCAMMATGKIKTIILEYNKNKMHMIYDIG